MKGRDIVVLTRKPKSLLPWTGVGILVGGLCLVAAAEMQPLEKHYEAARIALSKGDDAQAKRELKLSLQDDPLHAKSHLLLASLYGRAGDVDQAIVGFQRTMTLDPNNPVARYNLGTTLLWRGEPVSAARQIEEAITLRPEYVPAYNNLAKAYYLAGLPELAVASYQEALRRDPANAIALKSLAALTVPSDSQNALWSGVTNAPAKESGKPKATPAPSGGQEPPPTAPEPTSVSDAERDTLRESLRDLPHVTVERRGDRLVLGGWTSSAPQRKLLDRIITGHTDVLDLTTDDTGDPHRLLEVDATIFMVLGIESTSVGQNFLRNVQVNASLFDGANAAWGWLYSAAITYQVNIANASEQRIALLARPHLTTLSGTPATFTAGGDIVYKVTGNIGGDIKPYPFGTTLNVVPTLLRTRGEDGSPRIHVTVMAGRKSLVALADLEALNTESSTVFDNVSVSSEAVLGLGQTLILTGLNQREVQRRRSGVPGLRDIPVIKYLFSTKTTAVSDLSIIILLTPRDPAFWDEQNRQAIEAFVAKRRAFVQAERGTAEDLQHFKDQYPDWNQLAPNRFASHFFLMKNSDVYRKASGMELASDDLDFDLLGKPLKKQ